MSEKVERVIEDVKPTHCANCGMLVDHAAEFHTIVYCQAFKVCLDGKAVRTNIDYTVENHPKFKALVADYEKRTEELRLARAELKYKVGGNC